MSKIILITGTDTGIGKTYFTKLLLKKLLADGENVSAIKPIETGCDLSASGELLGPDASDYAEILGERIADVLPLAFSAPVAPIVASKTEIDTDSLISKIKEKAKHFETLLVEGAGGLLVPIKNNYTYADLARELNAELILVVGSKLGSLNHASLSFEVIKNKGLKMNGYVLNDLFSEDTEDISLKTNREVLAQIAKSYGFLELGYLAKDTDSIGENEKFSKTKV